MKKLFIVLAIIVAIPVLLFAVAAVVLATLDLNDYKSEIAQIVKDQTGRTLTVNGSLKKSFIPWLGVSVSNVALSNAKGFGDQPFVAVKQVEVKIDTLSLFRLQPAIDKIRLHGLNLQLAKNASGKTNWDDLTAAKAGSKPAPAAPPAEKEPSAQKESPAQKKSSKGKQPDTVSKLLAGLSVNGIEVKNAQLVWDDRQAHAHYEVRKLDLDVGEIALNKPLSLVLSVELESQNPPLKGTIELSSPRVEWDINQQRYAVLPLDLNVTARGEFLDGQPVQLAMVSNINTDLTKQRLSVNLQKLQAMGISLSGSADVEQLLSSPNFTATLNLASFNPRDVLNTLQIKLPPMADKNALTRLGVQTEVKGNLQQVEIPSLQVKLDDTTLQTKASLKNFAKPVINASVAIDKINVDHYLPPKAPSEKSKSDKATGKAPEKTAGDAGPEQPLPIPLELIRSLNVAASLTIKQLTIMGLDSTDAQLKLTAKNGIVDVKPFAFQTADGKLESQVSMDASQAIPRYHVQQTIQHLESNPIVLALIEKDIVSGKLDLTADVSTQGLLVSDIKKNLNGAAKFRFENGAVKGFNLGEMARKAYAKLKQKDYKGSKAPLDTDFAELTGSATIKNGVVTNNDLSAKSPQLRVAGKGTVELPRDHMNYLVMVKLTESNTGQGGEEFEDVKGLDVPIRIKGPFDNLDINIDWPMLNKAFQAHLKKLANKAIKKKQQEVKKKVEKKAEKVIEKKKKKLEDKLKKMLKF